MNTSLSIHEDYQPITFSPSYENVHALLADIHLYVFGRDGKLLGSQAVRREKVMITLDANAMKDAIIVISPPLESAADEALSLTVARRQPIFETSLIYDSEQASYVLPPVPEVVWRWWLVHSLWNNVRQISKKKNRLLGW